MPYPNYTREERAFLLFQGQDQLTGGDVVKVAEFAVAGAFQFTPLSTSKWVDVYVLGGGGGGGGGRKGDVSSTRSGGGGGGGGGNGNDGAFDSGVGGAGGAGAVVFVEMG